MYRSHRVKRLGLLPALILLTGALGAQTPNAFPKGFTVHWLTAQGTYREVYKEMAAAVEADTGVKVEFQVVPDNQFRSLVKVKLASGEVPDVFEYNSPSGYVEVNAADALVDLSNQPWVGRMTNGKLLRDTSGKIYALPREASSFFGACYYNKKVFASLGLKEPTTYAEFLALLEKIKTSGKGITPLYMSNKDTWTTQIFMTLGFSVALYPNDTATYAKIAQGQVNWSDVPQFKTILGQYQDLYKKGYINRDNLSATYDMAKEAVATGKAAMMLNGEWAVADIAAKWPGTELGGFIIPFQDKQIMATGAYVTGLLVPKAGKNVPSVLKFLDLWSQPKYQNIFYKKYPGFPGVTGVDGGQVNPAVGGLVAKYVTTGKYTFQINDPLAEYAGPIFPELWNLYVEMVSTNSTPESVLKKWDAKVKDFQKSRSTE